jgi:excisionase family DNA binding protein
MSANIRADTIMEQLAPIFVTVNEAKRLLAVGHTRIYELMNSGAIEKVKSGGKTLIPFESVQRYAASLRKEAEVA